MCIICYSPSGTELTESQLVNSNSNNPDGFGWAVRTPNGIVTGKTMDGDQAIESFLDLRSRYAEFDAVYHARITTHGETVIENNHPFHVGDNRTVLVHNGMLPITPPKGDLRSDTRIFAEDRLTRMGIGVLDKSKEFAKLERWMSGSKMVVMTTRDDMNKDTYILNESAGVWDKGLWFSNSTYTYLGRYLWASELTDSTRLDSDVECANPECGLLWDSESDSVIGGVCFNCWHCIDCGADSVSCFCYNPSGDNGWWSYDNRTYVKR